MAITSIQPVQGPQGDSGGFGGLGGLAGALVGGAVGALTANPGGVMAGAMAGASLGQGAGNQVASIIDPATQGGNVSSSIPAISHSPLGAMSNHPEVLNAKIADAKSALKEASLPAEQFDSIHNQLNAAQAKLKERLIG